jgi:FAD/FMN-containing dehydrogenase
MEVTMTLKDELTQIVGAEYVFDAPEALEAYSRDYSLLRPSRPSYVVQPKTTAEIQKFVRLANEHRVPIIPCSSRIHFNGTTIPSEGGVVMDLRRMNGILDIDDQNRRVRVEPGVTWGQLQAELQNRDWMVVSPLLPHSLRSVAIDLLEREVPLIPIYEYGEPIETVEVVWPNGEVFRTGSASTPGYPDCAAEGTNYMGPGIDFLRFLQGAQGTMGVVTWANVKIEYRPKVNQCHFVLLPKVEDAIEPIYRIQRQRVGHECFVLNNLNLATILAQNWPQDFHTLRSLLPPWTLLLILSGGQRRPEGRVAYEEQALKRIKDAEFPWLDFLTSIPGVPGVERRLPDMLRRPWPEELTYWKHRYRGCSQDLMFITRLENVPTFVEVVAAVAARHEYPIADIGCYLQPIEHARACHCEFNFYYNGDDAKEREQVRQLYAEAAESLLDRSAFFTRPYGALAELVYGKATAYTTALKKVKNILDPNNIMCPGKLCF